MFSPFTILKKRAKVKRFRKKFGVRMELDVVTVSYRIEEESQEEVIP